MRRRPCLDCGKPTAHGARCPQHDRENARRHDKSRKHGLYDRAWNHPTDGLRARVLLRDAHTCRLQLRGCTIVATAVHLDPALEGNHHHATPADCVAACAHCHGIVDGGRAHRSRTQRREGAPLVPSGGVAPS